MTKYEIYCAECRKRFIVNDHDFTEIVKLIEKQTGEITSILHRSKIPCSYKSHEHISCILQPLIRCCVKPEIYFTEVKPPDEVDRLLEECKKRRIEKAKMSEEERNVRIGVPQN